MIGHNGLGTSPDWLLERVAVKDISTGRVYQFLCGQWLRRSDNTLERTLEVHAGPIDTRPKVVQYFISILTADERGEALVMCMLSYLVVI